MKHPASITLTLLMASAALVAAPATRTSWEFAPFSWIRRQPAEHGAPANAQPLRVQSTILQEALATVQYVHGVVEQPLFAPDEVAGMSRAMAEALALARPDEDLVMLSTSKRETGMLGESLAITARVFVQDGKLNLIIHDARLDFVYDYYANFQMPEFEYGSRAKAGAVTLKAPGAVLRRPDWVVLPLAAPAKPQPVVQAAPALSLEERLLGLKRVRAQDLITEEEYQQKRKDLLKDY